MIFTKCSNLTFYPPQTSSFVWKMTFNEDKKVRLNTFLAVHCRTIATKATASEVEIKDANKIVKYVDSNRGEFEEGCSV